MKIYPIKALVAASVINTLIAYPQKLGKAVRDLECDKFVKEMFIPYEDYLIAGLTKIKETNFRGGVIHKFDEKSISLLKERLLKDTSKIDYQLPVDNTSNIYIEPFGMFMAKRPAGRPHLGLDIFATPYAKKPEKPVLIKSPVDGVVISEKHTREEDNVIANSITILGKDGRRYGFEHMARGTDYPDSIPLPKLGTYMHKGDSIGYIGHTGETVMWHLHLTVMTDEQLVKQLKSPKWQNIQKNSPYSVLRGQVNPLNPSDAGPLANLLQKYRH